MRPDPHSIITRLDEVELTDVSTETSEASSSVWHRRTLTADDLLQMLLDENAEPKALPLYLLEEITNYFSDDQEIGRGSIAVVYKGMLGNVTVAVKKLSGYLSERSFHQEVECLMKAKHKNIIRFLGYCSDTRGEMLSYKGKLVMADVQQRLLCFELLPRGSLSDYIIYASGGFEWRTRYKIIEGICQGLNYLHQNRILHLDLNPENILMDDNMVPKIGDFCLLTCFSQQQTHATRLAGRMGYMPPEYFNGTLTFQTDIYSLGVIIMEMLTGKKGYCDVEYILESWSNRIDMSLELEQVRVCAKIGIECTDFNPVRRPTIHHIIDRLVECDPFENEKSGELHHAAALIKDVSGIDTDGWGSRKIATALNKTWCIERAGKSCKISEDEVSRLVNDADKYEVKLDKDACLKVSRQMLQVYDFRAHVKKLLKGCVLRAKEAYEAE
ncbi:cysteine-rich receptor-like protein kinase 44 [Triticum urartu]|uniref:cysteine-rich receptor-like protein kinase 44 n=1 Tax=Triticum urartu TaxID=4572 RepID=UPI002043C2B2|nr:cysteine-rich receptor-like protein kinase 44 [Triticum urartu]